MLLHKRFKMTAAIAAMALVPWSVHAQQKDPVRIGAVTSLSGVWAQQGEEVMRGIQFAVDEANQKGGVDGRKVLIEKGDDEGTPEAGRRTAEKLARGGNNLLVGTIASSIALALAQNLDRWDAMFVTAIPKADRITGDACKPRMFRSNHSDSMDVAMINQWMKDIPEKKFAVLANDYVWGRDSADHFTKAAQANGKTIATGLYPPVGTKDFAPYIAQLKAIPDLDGVWVALVGRDLTGFAKQAEEFGLTSKRILGHAYILSFVVNSTGTATKGVWGNIPYGPDIDTPLNKAFVNAWKTKFNRLPTDNEGQAYNSVQAVFEGVRKSGSVKPADVSKGLRGATYETIYGSTTMRAEDNQLILPTYAGQVKEVGGVLRPVIEKTFPASIAPPPNAACKLS